MKIKPLRYKIPYTPKRIPSLNPYSPLLGIASGLAGATTLGLGATAFSTLADLQKDYQLRETYSLINTYIPKENKTVPINIESPKDNRTIAINTFIPEEDDLFSTKKKKESRYPTQVYRNPTQVYSNPTQVYRNPLLTESIKIPQSLKLPNLYNSLFNKYRKGLNIGNPFFIRS